MKILSRIHYHKKMKHLCLKGLFSFSIFDRKRSINSQVKFFKCARVGRVGKYVVTTYRIGVIDKFNSSIFGGGWISVHIKFESIASKTLTLALDENYFSRKFELIFELVINSRRVDALYSFSMYSIRLSSERGLWCLSIMYKKRKNFIKKKIFI